MQKPVFKFVGVDDTGPESGACCPHCGSEGRYIYNWTEDGKLRRAMAGCYKRLTGQLARDAESKYMELLAEKQAKNKPLNSWDKTVVRMLKYQQDNASDAGKVNWAATKIIQTLSERQATLSKKGRFNGR